MSGKPLDPDFVVSDHSSIVLFTPNSKRAQDWASAYLPDDCPMLGTAYAVERRYAQDIVDGIRADGMRVVG